MKRRSVTGLFAILLALMVGAVVANAQGINSYKGHIPFDFSIGNVDYAAGNYILRFKDQTKLATIFTMAEEDGPVLLARAVIKSGNTTADGDLKLTFRRYGDIHVLEGMRAPNFAFKAPKGKTATWVYITENLANTEIVTVAMTR